jgi:hypothetical protein
LGLPLSIFEEKIDLCKKGDEITPFDGTSYTRSVVNSSCLMFFWLNFNGTTIFYAFLFLAKNK